MSGVTAYLVKRAAQKERVRILYRRALKDTLNWAVHRHLFYPDADDLREKFEANKHEDIETIDRLIADGEASYNKWRHPDPYIVKSSLSSFEHFHGLLVAPSSPETLRRLLGLRLCTTMEKKMLSHCDPLSWKQIKIEVVCS